MLFRSIGRWTETFARSGTTERILNESSPTKAYDLLVNEINRVDRLVLPNVNIRSDGKLPWNSRQIRTQKKSVEWLYQRSKRSNNPQLKASYRTQQKRLNRTRTKVQYENLEKRLLNAKDFKSLYRMVSEISQSKNPIGSLRDSAGTVVEDNPSKAEILLNH